MLFRVRNHRKCRQAPRFCRTAALWALLAIIRAAAGTTEVCGTLSLSTEWTRADSPYLVINDLHVPPRSRLAIEPGVTVHFTAPRPCPDGRPLPQADWSDSQFVALKIEGGFYAVGTEKEPIVFAPREHRPGSIVWDGIRFKGQREGRAELGFAVLRGAHKALHAENARFFVHHNLIEDNNTGLWLSRWSEVTVLNNNFIGNRSAGLYVEGSQPRIVSNLFYGNLGYGLWSDRNPAVTIRYNAFFDNRDGDCHLCPFWVLRPEHVNANEDTCDRHFNVRADPVFEASPSHKLARQRDLGVNTPPHKIRDSILAAMEREKRKDASRAPSRAESFRPLGEGTYRLSAYSKLIDAGHPGEGMRDRDGSVNDIGMHGGHMGRIVRSPL